MHVSHLMVHSHTIKESRFQMNPSYLYCVNIGMCFHQSQSPELQLGSYVWIKLCPRILGLPKIPTDGKHDFPLSHLSAALPEILFLWNGGPSAIAWEGKIGKNCSLPVGRHF